MSFSSTLHHSGMCCIPVVKISFKFLWYDTETTGTNTQPTVKFIISLTKVMPGNYYAQ